MNNPKQQCYSHHHLTATEYAIYDVCRALAMSHDGIVFFSGPKIAKRFRSMSKNTPYTALKKLVKAGWFVLVKASEINAATGKHTASHYRVLSHEEWVVQHPNSCSDHSETWQETLSGLEGADRTPSQSEGKPSKAQGMDRPNLRESPSQRQGTNLYQPIGVTHPSTDAPDPPSKVEGTDTAPLSWGSAIKAPAPHLEGEPYPELVTVNAAVSAIMSVLGERGAASVSAWRDTVDRLNREGHKPEVIADTVKFFAEAYPEQARAEGAKGFPVCFPWLLRDLTARQIEEMRSI